MSDLISLSSKPLDQIECNERNNCESCDPLKTIEISSKLPEETVSLSTRSPKTVESESQTDIVIIENNELKCNDQLINNENLNKSPPTTTITEIRSTNEKYDQNNIEVNSKYFDEPELSIIEIHENLIDKKNVPLSADSESEEDDQLKPLMIDNHTVLDHPEFYNNNIINNNTNNNILPPIHPTTHLIKHSDRKDSFSSNDSDLVHLDHKMIRTNIFDCDDDSQNANHYSDEFSKDYCERIAIPKSTITSTILTPTTQTSSIDYQEIDMINPNEIPDDLILSEIVEHVEYYFSNESILKDAFLLKHVRRNKEGFVSLKLISSFKRVRQYTKDWRIVGYAIRKKSDKIELNDVGTKVRRIDPLPSFDETMPSRTIVVCDIPVARICIEHISELFSKCGEIALVRILRPGNTIPIDVRQFMNKYPEMQQKECALVEFVESHSARYAQTLDGNFKVYEMIAPKKKTGKKSITVTKLIENYKYYDNNYERSRGGGGVGGQNVSPNPNENDFKYKLKRNNSEYCIKPEHICPQRKYSYNNNNTIIDNTNFVSHYQPRRFSNCSVNSSDMSRKYSSCSEGYSSCSELSRRPSSCSSGDQSSRRTSSCSDFCPCSRRSSQCSEMFRRVSQCSEYNNNNNNNTMRKYSNGSISNNNLNSYDRSLSNQSQDMGRRVSMDSNCERKISAGSIDRNQILYDQYRKHSNGFDPNRKLSNTDQYINGRRISTDSGYDRRLSFSSDYSTSPRSRSNSFLMCQHKNVEQVVRTPIGPDGSKGFSSRSRKQGQTIGPV